MLAISARLLSTSLARPSRFLSTSTLSPTHQIYISTSTNPYFNLTLEDWLFRTHSPSSPLLLIYRDDPCVVIGRNQNPWKEVNLDASRRRGIPWIRRRSGGGTVFHDLGNTNFSIHLPRTSFDRNATAQIILRAVRSLGIDAHVNDRNDICVGRDKVSGSAYKIVNKRAYHHGTMLISTQLDTLGDLLRTNKETMVTRGVASVRSPVCNLRQWSGSVSHEIFSHAVVNEFRKEHAIEDKPQMVDEDHGAMDIEYIRDGMAELPSWDWKYGQTPEFTYTLTNIFTWGDVKAEIRSKHGLILSCSFTPGLDLELVGLEKHLEGKKYGFVDTEDVKEGKEKDVWMWLTEAMVN